MADDDALVLAASDPQLTEDAALALLVRRDLPPRAIEALRRNPALANRRKVLPIIAAHPRTPRHISMALVRQLFTFELLRVVQTPGAPADIQRLCEDSIMNRLASESAGERLTLAKSATGRIAAALLHDAEARICEAALNNPRLTEALIVPELRKREVGRHLIDALQQHSKWSLRREIRDVILARTERAEQKASGDDSEREEHEGKENDQQ